jgi:hypothetical protein
MTGLLNFLNLFQETGFQNQRAFAFAAFHFFFVVGEMNAFEHLATL